MIQYLKKGYVMKKIKYLILIIVVLVSTGCFKRDNLEGIKIVTSVYPLEYVTSYMYKDHSTITSIYPDGVDTTTYSLSKKQISDYSKEDLFIYNGLGKDKDITVNFLDKNKSMLIIDASYGMEYTYDISELWLNPSNLLMITQNIKDGLKEYITNSYLEKEIDDKYLELELKLSELDAEIKTTAVNAKRNTIVVNSDTLKYLEKYGFNVISLDETNTQVSDKEIQHVLDLISIGDVKHIILLENTDNSEATIKVLNDSKISTYMFRKLDSITDNEREELKDYISIMNENINMLKDELY